MEHSGWAGRCRKRRATLRVAVAEWLEERRLLAGVTFAAPVSTPLPAGFQLERLQLGPSVPQSGVVPILATSQTGGGLIIGLASDGTGTILQRVNTSAMLLDPEHVTIQTGGTFTQFDAIATTSGLMLEQSDGTFAAPSGLTLPSDVVPDVYAITSVGPATQALVIERYTPLASDPTHGTVSLANFGLQLDGTYGPEVDTVVATDVAGNPLSGPLLAADFNHDQDDDLVLLNHIWYATANGTFSEGPQVSALAPSPGARVYSMFPRVTSGPDLVFFPGSPAAGNSDTAQAFLHQSDTSYSPAGTADFGPAGTTNGRLIINDFTGDNVADLVTGIRSGSRPTGVAVAIGIGDGTPPPAQARPNAFPAPDLTSGIVIGGGIGEISAASINNGFLTVADGVVMPSIKVGMLASGYGIKSVAPLEKLEVGSAEAGSVVDVAAIGKLISRGDFDADMTLSGGPAVGSDVLDSATLGGSIAAGPLGDQRERRESPRSGKHFGTSAPGRCAARANGRADLTVRGLRRHSDRHPRYPRVCDLEPPCRRT